MSQKSTTRDSGKDVEALSGATLALFMTYGFSVTDWAERGMVPREAALYNELSQAFDTIYIFTYGSDMDAVSREQFAANVKIIDKRHVDNDLLYSLLLPLVHWRILRTVDVIKTNQMLGSWTAVLASLLYRVPLVVRTGYILSKFAREQGTSVHKRALIYLIEYTAYNLAAGIITSSPHGRAYIEERYGPSAEHLMIPNYIETSVFEPLDVQSKEQSVCFIGRLDEQKNLSALIDAVDHLPCSLSIVGDGPLREDLAEQAARVGADVEFVGRLPNHDLPEFLNRHEVFVLPSHYEGMPKSLLEAMSCGLAVVGTDVPGTSDILVDRENGLLCETHAESLRAAIDELLTDEALRAELGRNARQTILEEYSLARLSEQELSLHARVVT